MRPFLDELDVSHLDLPTRTLLSLTIVPSLLRKVEEHGLEVSVERSLQALTRFHQKRTDGRQLFSVFREECQKTDDAVLAIFLGDQGRMVGCVAARLVWCEQTLAEEFAKLSFLYGHPSLAPQGETCLVTAPSSRETIMACPLAFTGAGYMNPDYRKNGLFSILYRLLKVLMLVDWKWSWEISVINDRHELNFPADTYGFGRIEPFMYHRGERHYLVCSRRREVWDQILREDIAEVRSLASR